ncbi:MAG: hypothetical protein ACLRUB_00040 [Streptococcus sp.]
MLLTFGEYSGLGMKTSLGMGGIKLEEEKIDLFYGALLHDIGKVIQGRQENEKNTPW